MQKATTVLLGALVLALTILVIWWAGPRRRTPSITAVPSVTEPMVQPAPLPDAGRGPLESLLSQDTTHRSALAAPGTRLLDGSVPPPLPATAPRSLRFGVVLVQYRGAQRAAPGARSREQALEMAQELLTLAETDFKAAVQKGDPGSATDLGRIEANILEPAPNFVLFTLSPGGVGGPVDTPTGYWILKNLSKSADGKR